MQADCCHWLPGLREGDNYHGTEEPGDFDNATFLETMLDSLVDE